MIYVIVEGKNTAKAFVYEEGTKEYVWADDAFDAIYRDCPEEEYENIDYNYRKVNYQEYLAFCSQHGIIPTSLT